METGFRVEVAPLVGVDVAEVDVGRSVQDAEYAVSVPRSEGVIIS